MKQRPPAELFLTGPIAHVDDQSILVYDPVEKTTLERMLFTKERNWSLLFFYPADFSYVCPTELTKLNTFYEEFHQEGVDILVISRDSLLVHKKRVEVEPQLANFKIKMVSDREAVIGKDIGLLNTSSGEYERAILLCSPAGKVAYMQITNASIGRNVDEVLRVVKALNHIIRHPEKVCPESWHDGQEDVEVQRPVNEHVIFHI